MRVFRTEHSETWLGNCMVALDKVQDETIHTCVTSPPYFNLRDYGTGTWEGGNDPGCDHVRSKGAASKVSSTLRGGHLYDGEKLLEISEQFKGKCKKCGAVRTDEQIGAETTADEYVEKLVEVFRKVNRVLRNDGTLWLNLGDTYSGEGLLGIPWKVAFALKADGWILRQDIIWAKPNPMPESVENRCTKSHEYMFLFAKKPAYFYDHEAIKDRITPYVHTKIVDGRVFDTANKRSVWTVAGLSFPGSHFAVFPPNLILPCILAGTSEKGACSKCGTPWKRIIEKERRDDGMIMRVKTVGWEPSCSCKETAVVPCKVLDPFAGSGTTGEVSIKHGRSFVGVDLSPEYFEMIKKRLRKAEVEKGF